ncbi:MAG: hypothetical protein ABSF63_13225 [Candidatus Bathyarchaeia archaeon]|jgi:hypothetical protein
MKPILETRNSSLYVSGTAYEAPRNLSTEQEYQTRPLELSGSTETVLEWRKKDLAGGIGCKSSACLTAVCPISECVCHCPDHIGHGKLQKKNRRIDEYLEDGADKPPASTLLMRLWV